ncbi:MAG: formate dehydrogenase [Acidobacteria bacterium]|nr:MAG: formate dehydrogenase [Acidobacteriota bacterium]
MATRKPDRTKIASLSPFGLGHVKPHHYLEMAKVAWENRGNIPYAWRILTRGVCDGCSLGPYGLHDNTMKGVHLCLVRLRMLRMNTMPALDISCLDDVSLLRNKAGKELRNLGRLPYPMIRKKGEKGFRRISWDEAIQTAAQYLRGIDPHRFAIYTTSRGLTNEVYYVAGKFARLMGSNNIDNAARLCHAASTTALKQTLGVAASTCSYSDWIGTDLIVLAGANLASNQPVSIKYLYYAKKKGARIAVVNPYREPGLDRYWVPSITKSALFGTKFIDDFFPITVGGDIAFYNGVMKILIENNWLDFRFIQNHTNHFEELKRDLAQQSWEILEQKSGTSRNEMYRFAELYSKAGNAIFIWSMGLTQHRFGVENVKALVNVALARGMIGRPNVGVVPIRGHSGVQGAAETGSVPGDYFMGLSVSEMNAKKLEGLWQTPDVPNWKGMSAPVMVDAAHDGKLNAFYIIGGNFTETMPDPLYAAAALENVPLRIHQDLILNSSMFVEPKETVLLFPSQTRYEQKGGGTITNTERRIRLSPEIPGPRIGEARSEWEIIIDLAKHTLPPEKFAAIQYSNGQEIRDEMDRVIPLYKGIKDLKAQEDSFQYGGTRLLENGICDAMPDQRALFTAVRPQNEALKPDEFYMTTRRGRQFNSMVYTDGDPLIGSRRRDEIFISPKDAIDLQLKEGDKILLKSTAGEFSGVCRISDVHPHTIQVFWPEANVLLPRRIDPNSMEPDYNTIVTVEKMNHEGTRSQG